MTSFIAVSSSTESTSNDSAGVEIYKFRTQTTALLQYVDYTFPLLIIGSKIKIIKLSREPAPSGE